MERDGVGEPDLPSISVAMATHNRRELLPRVLAPLLEDHATSEIVVVVDGSRDGSFELLEELAFRDARVRPVLIPPSGRSRAQQAAIDRTSGEVVLLLDDDVVGDPGLVTGHAAHHARARSVVLVGYMPPVLPPERAPGQFATFQYAREYEYTCAAYERDPRQVLLNLWGGNVSLRRADLERVPLHADDQALYHSDRDFGLRCLKTGLTGIFDRSLSARHIYSRSLGEFVRDARLQGKGHFRVHQLHRDVIGELDLGVFVADAKPRTRLVIRSARSPLVRPLVTAGLRVLVKLAGSAQRFPLETRAALLLRLIEQQGAAQKLLANPPRVPSRGTSG